MTTSLDHSLIIRALDTPRLDLPTTGRAIGSSRTALVKYRSGQRPMPEGLRLKLAAYLDAHARRLGELAQALRA
jgi:hypothetical protein